MYMIMFSSFSITVMMYVFGQLYVNFAVWIGIWSGIGIYIFLTLIGAVIKKYNRNL